MQYRPGQYEEAFARAMRAWEVLQEHPTLDEQVQYTIGLFQREMGAIVIENDTPTDTESSHHEQQP